ncbi:DMT family transporter [Kribbella sancticallisti]|uniref:DMT family transporter n=1 Tax=Kribbella sancticallisti TaxID=460087 RepID=A0ABN2DQY4_9ACTN
MTRQVTAAGRPGWRVFAAVVLLGGLWGSSFPLIRVAAPSLGAAGVTHGRVQVAATILAAVITLNVRTARTAWRAVGGAIGPLLLLAAFNVALPLTLVATSIVSLNASLAAVLNASTPLFAVGVAAVWLHQAVNRRKAVGVAIGILGVVILVGGASLDLDWSTALAIAASLTAGLLYALGGVYTQVRFAETRPLVLATGQQLAAALLLIPASAMAPPRGPVTAAAASAVLVVGAGATAGGYLLYFWIIRAAGPVAASTVTLIVPIAGSVIGVLWLDEPLTLGLVLGTAVILTAVGLLIGPARTQYNSTDAAERTEVTA